MTENPKFKEISNMSLNASTLLNFITRIRRRLGWKTTEKEEYEVAFLLALIVSVVSVLIFGAFHIFHLLPFWIVFVWTATTILYVTGRRTGKGSSCDDMDRAIDVIKKAIKRGKVGIERKSSTSFCLVGTYHNDLIGEDVSDTIGLDEKDVVELYDSLDGLGNFGNNAANIELPVSTIQIPFNK